MTEAKKRVKATQVIPPVAAATKPRFKGMWLIAAICLLGIILRLIFLGRASYQIDEIVTVRDAVSQASVFDIYHTELQRFVWYRVLPLFMVPIHWAAQMASDHASFPPEWLARLPGALLGALGLPLFYFIGRTVAGRRAGLIAMALATISPFHLYYCREAYSYGYVMTFSAGTLWMSLLLLKHDWSSRSRLPWMVALGYMILSSLFLQAHMTCSVFLAVWNLVLAVALLLRVGFKNLFKLRTVSFFALTLGAPYIVFAPFILQLLKAGYKSTDASAHTIYFNVDALKAILGRMGWGEAWWCLVPFIVVTLLGVRFIGRAQERKPFRLCLVLFIQTVLYVAFQGFYQKMTDSRFEVRYFSSAFPILVVLAASGLDFLWGRLTASKSNSSAENVDGVVATSADTKRSSIPAVVFVSVPFLWLSFNAALVITLGTRGYNYKGIAQWLEERLPENGVYAFYNVYELRGVPNVYHTPGRDATAVAAWSTQEDFDRAKPVERAKSLFTRIPQAVFVEISPADLLAPEIGTPPIDRDGLFMRHEWIEDPIADRLFHLKTHPVGEVQWMNHTMHRSLMSYNLPEDLPLLAKKHGQMFYHAFGTGWRYFNDQGYTHWMSVSDTANFSIGNVTTQTVSAVVHIRALAPPPGSRLHVLSSSGAHLAAYELHERGLTDIRIPGQSLSPGTTDYRVTVTPLTPGPSAVQALVYSIDAEPELPRQQQ